VRVCPSCGSGEVDATWRCPGCGWQVATIDGFPAFAPDAADGAGFSPELFSELTRVEARSWWFRARNDLIAAAMTETFPHVRSYLEIGCGTGFVLARIRDEYPAADLTGSELITAGLAVAAARIPSARFIQIDARRIPFRDEVDVIGAFDILEHIEADEEVLRSVAGSLRPGGGLVATVPQHPSLWSRQDVHAFHVRRYTAPELRRKVEAAGLEVVRLTSFVSLLLPMLVLSRLRHRGAAADAVFDPIADLRQPRLVDATLERVMDVERWLLRRGLRFPAGGSLLLVARRPA
jgi:SAM-dependent methyltransferase